MEESYFRSFLGLFPFLLGAILSAKKKEGEMLEDKSYAKYVEAGYFGLIRGVFGLVEHPLDLIKTRMQAEKKTKPVWQVCKDIYREKGFFGGYTAGIIPNGVRMTLKHMYRYPLMLKIPSFFKKNIPPGFQAKYPDAEVLATALSIASIETLIICPLERCKVFLMTSGSQINSARTFLHLCSSQYSELFRGMQAVWARQILSWGSFLYTNKKAKEWERKRLQTEELPFVSLMRVSLLTGLVNSICMPLDVAKTSLQKHNPSSDNLWITLVKIYKDHGIQGLYAGWQPRVMQYMIHSAITVVLLERLEKKYE